MGKIPEREVPSGDYVVTVDEVDYHPHEGESVWLIGSASPKGVELRLRWARLIGEIAVLDSDDKAMPLVEVLDKTIDEVSNHLAHRLARWNWTDLKGNALPPPTAEILKALEWQEIGYLLQVCNGSNPGTVKNASRPSETSSSATGTPKSRR